MPDRLNAVLVQRIEVAPGLVILRVAPDGWELPDFEAGQFAVLGLPGRAPRCEVSTGEEGEEIDPDKIIKRAYSIASSSVAREYLEFYVTLVPSGQLTPRLFALTPGDRLWLSPKISGLFTLDDVPADKNIVLIATGTGLAPYVSMLRTHLVRGDQRRYAVLHGARHSWDLGYRSELETVDRLCPNFTYLAVVSRPNEEPVPWRGLTGHLQDTWRANVLVDRWGAKLTSQDTHIFLCGNPAMIEDLVVILEAEGFKEHRRRDPGQIHVERYW